MLIDKNKGCIRSFISSKVFLHTKDVSEISLRRSFQSNGIGLTPDRGCNRAGFEGSVLAAAAAKAEGTGLHKVSLELYVGRVSTATHQEYHSSPCSTPFLLDRGYGHVRRP